MVTNEQIQALEAELARTSDPQEKIERLVGLARALSESDAPRAIALCEQALTLSTSAPFETRHNQRGLAAAHAALGAVHSQLAQHELALTHLYKALLQFQIVGDMPASAGLLTAMGDEYLATGDYPNALDYYLRALDLFRELGLREKEAALLNKIGLLHLNINEGLKALTYLRQSLQLAQALDDRSEQAAALDNSCNASLALKDYDHALQCGLRSRQLYQELKDAEGESRALESLGRVYLALGQEDQALGAFEQALDIADGLGLRVETLRALLRLGELYRKQGALEQALERLQQAAGLAEAAQMWRELYECHRALAETYEQAGDPARALAHYKQSSTIRDVVFNAEADRRLKSLEVAHQAERNRKESEIYQLKNVALLQEVRERKQAEANLREVNVQLQEEARVREQLIADLDAFAHTVAHDLKNPLAAVTLSSELLWKRLEGTLDPTTAEFLQAIRQMADKMGRIIRELLTLASVRQQDITPRPLRMGEVVKEAEERLRLMLEAAGAEVKHPEHWPVAMGYAPWVEEVWANYLSNALKYGGHPPRLELGAVMQADGQVRFWVHDNGDGVPAEKQADLFSPYARLEGTHIEGEGLGLSIVKRIVEKLGGQVGVESPGQPGQGSTFYFTLPVARQA
jgi:signal transduction histidine kinase